MHSKLPIPPLPVPIVTPRLTIRPIRAGDGALILDYKKASWPELARWMIWTHPPSIEVRTVQDEERFCHYKQNRFERREDLAFLALDRDNGLLIGAGGLHKCDWQIPLFIVGFSVRTGHTGRGYATEIAVALTHYAFAALAARKVTSFHAAGNIGSQRVIEKTGFEKEGVLRGQHRLPHGLVDEHHYGLLTAARLPALAVRWGPEAAPGGAVTV